MIYDVWCTSTSHDPDGSITAYHWEVTNAVPLSPPTPPNVPGVLFILDYLDGVSITLTVWDNNRAPNAATVTTALDASSRQILTRVLSKADTDGYWSILPNATAWRRWKPAESTILAVPRYNEHGPLIALASDGTIYHAADYLQSPPHAVGQLPTGCTTGVISVNDLADINDWLVGAETTLYRTQDGGETITVRPLPT